MSEQRSNVKQDAIARNRIISEMDQNFFVEAGAGSGKTTMLVNRMVAMVEAGIDINRICAITFTKAAAGEFYDRFQRKLIERSNPNIPWKDLGLPGMLPEPTEESRERCRSALQNIDLCFMGTIDSFCNMVLSEHPTEAGIPSDSAIIGDEELKAFYHQVYIRITEGDYGKELKEQAELFRALNGRNEHKAFQCAFPILMGNRNATFHYQEVPVVDVDTLFQSDRKQLLDALQTVINNEDLVLVDTNDARKAWEKLSDALRQLKRNWSRNYSSVMYSIKNIQKLRMKEEAMDRYAVSLGDVFKLTGKRKVYLACEDWAKELLDRLKDLQYNGSMTFLHACVPLMEQELKKKGYLTFFDNLYYLRNMLRKDAEEGGKLIRYIQARHSYFLIDEFQDTDPLQAQIFFYLSSENPNSLWYECQPCPGSLFIVGDPKQSIYRFKGADVSSFLNVRSLIEKTGGAVLKLSCNFRSSPVLLEYFNRVFSKMLPEDTAIQSRYDEIPIVSKAKDEFQGIYSYYVPSKKEIEQGAAEIDDPSMICRLIKTLHDNSDYLIKDRNGESRKITYSDFMIITNAKKELAPIMQVLDEAGIPMRVEGSVQFGENEALKELLLIYKAVADPEDRISLYGALRGKIIGINDDEIFSYEDSYRALSLFPPEKKEEKESRKAGRVREVLEKLNGIYKKSLRLSPSGLLSLLMEKLEIFRYVSTENLEVLYYTLELMRKAETAGSIVSAKDGSIYLSDLVEESIKEERCLRLTDREDCVHMANLHKVKGLEAPVVIIASKGDRKNAPTTRIEHNFDGSDAYIFKVGEPGAINTIYLQSSEFTEESEAEKEVSDAEQKRLAYVAATRARNVLIIGDKARSKWADLMDDSMKNAVTGLLTGDTTEEKDQCDDNKSEMINDLYQSAEEGNVLNKKRVAEEESFELCNPSKSIIPSKMESETKLDETEGQSIPDLNENPRVNAALMGTMVHRLMEMLVSSRNRIDGNGLISQILSEYRTPENEPIEQNMRSMLQKTLETIQHGGYPQTNGQPQDILNTLLNADEVYCEMPFSYVDGGELWNGIMDVVYYADGKWHIVDYKTNLDGSDLDNKYQKQLDAYKKAFLEINGEEADAGTYHIEI